MMRATIKGITGSGVLVLILTAFAAPALAQSQQNTQALLTSRAEKTSNGMAGFRTLAPQVEQEKGVDIEMPAVSGVVMTKTNSWDGLSDDEKKAFASQLSASALRWPGEIGATSSSVRKENGGLFVNRGPQPLQARIQN